jgi:peptidoglycan/LPS O-acetylase OafA/YrhL
MLERTLAAYAGALLIPVLLLPLAYFDTMGGHSLMFIVLLGVSAGVAAGLVVSDLRRQLDPPAVIVRAVVAVLALLACVAAIALLRDTRFLENRGWALVPVCAPAIAALLSGLVLRGARRGAAT